MNLIEIIMGKGDIKTKRGKIFNKSYGVSRSPKKTKPNEQTLKGSKIQVKAEKAVKAEKPTKTEKVEKSVQVEKVEKVEKTAKTVKAEKTEKAVKTEKEEKPKKKNSA
jgi:1,4-alpha-glucan branching enzyme